VAAASDAAKWFQLYVHRDAGLTASLVARAEGAGYRALVVTADTPVLGRRIGDERHGFALPPPLTMPNLEKDLPLERRGGSALAQWFADRHCASFTWRDLEALRARTKLPIVVKGILRPDDAARAVALGAAGIVVSNHGGRQLDGVPATVDALPGVVDAVAGRAEVLVDGGIRWGGDVLKALALGARAVLLGRPILWGLGVAGADGVRDVLELVRSELSRALALAGVIDVNDVPKDLVRLSGSMVR
jgi:4-hydroxymandelate oxidase